ncbi:sulfite exporter TauE/SafE family protein [Acrocarpospora pleiomorpha]|uniref:sulfite exporter TauE/SafE family protein n=1 Tax=Acrocarpospora pleiomorpha TaxID=90975 RepID=UPI001FE4F920|nr:sulfite exporter TauE/SafE family protein [Acrocarpospora pleiomorpha]
MLVEVLVGFGAGLLIAMFTTPVGVSGAVFLLPVQLSVLGVPSPAITPTNLLFNVVSGPGALMRYRRNGSLISPLTRQLIVGTLPGVVIGAIIRVFVVPGPQVFRILVAAFLLPLGVWLCVRTLRPVRHRLTRDVRTRTISLLALVVGVVGGVYGIGGGSILGPILVGWGMPVGYVAPAALASTFLTSIVGALAYTVLALTTSGDIAPEWLLGLCCGFGGLIGGYLGARLQPRLPETGLRLLLGALAMAVALLYVMQSL